VQIAFFQDDEMQCIRILLFSCVAVNDNNNNANKIISKYKMDYLYCAETFAVILS